MSTDYCTTDKTFPRWCFMLDIILVHNTASQYCFKIVGHNFTSLSPSLSRSFPTNSLDTAIRSTSSKSTTSTAEKTDQWLYCLLWTNTVCYSWLSDLISVASAVHTTSNIVRQYLRHLQYKIWWLDSCHELEQAVSCQQKRNSTNTWEFRKL